jgi:hypothetical protein
MAAHRSARCIGPLLATPIFALCGILGCSSVHVPGGSLASAPGLRNGDSMPMRRNVADPNAPFTLMPQPAHLEKREPILDIDEVPDCAPQQLNFFESRAESNGPHHSLRFTIANGGTACRLGGFPSITLLAPDGSVLGGIHVRKVSRQSLAATLGPVSSAPRDAALDRPSPQVLVLARGQAAFQLGWTTGANCEQVGRIAIAAPGQTATIVIPRTLTVCESQVLVTAVAGEGSE